MAGHHANEAMIERIKSSDQWAFYQAKGIKSAVLGSKIEMLESQHKKASPKDEEKMEQYKKDQEKISEEAKKDEESSEAHLSHHVVIARAVTFFQVAIAIGAISALTRRKAFWFVSMGFGAIGVVFFAMGLFS